MRTPVPSNAAPRVHQQGVALIVVLLILLVASLLGAGAARIALMAERGARNDRDAQLAWQAAEAALVDAELDIHGPAPGSRSTLLGALQNTNAFAADCGQSSGEAPDGLGLCALVDTGAPAWLTVDFTQTGANARTVGFGHFTGREFAAGANGIQPAQAPRYVIEPLVDPGNRDLSSVRYVFRITAMGFGPRPEIQSVAQTIYRN